MATKRIRFKGRVHEGKLQMYHKLTFQNGLNTFNGRDIYITIEPFSQQRSSSQNNYYWSVVISILCEEMGYMKMNKNDREEVHNALRLLFLETERNGIRSVKSTTQLNTAEFEEYLRNIRMWANTEYSIVIPKPNEVIIEDDFTFTAKTI